MNTAFFDKTSKLALVGFVLLMVMIQLYTLAMNKPFWEDEWYILLNIKNQSYSALLSLPLEYNQQFPRGYIVLVKFFSELFGGKYFTYRFFPFVFSLGSVLFSYTYLKKRYENKYLNIFIGVIILMSYHTYIHYFSMVKQYSAEIFFSVISFHQLALLNKNKHSFRDLVLFGVTVLLGSFFSLNYIVFLGIFLLVIFFKVLITKRLLPSFAFLFVIFLGMAISYALSIRFSLMNSGLVNYWDYLMFDNTLPMFLRGLFHLFGSVFSPDFSKYGFPINAVFLVIDFTIFASAFAAMIFVLANFIRSLVNLKVSEFASSQQFLVNDNVFSSLAISGAIGLYLLKMIPIGPEANRVISFLAFPITTLLLSSITFIELKSKFIGHYLVVIFLLSATLQIGNAYSKEIVLDSTYIPDNWPIKYEEFDNIGRAIQLSVQQNLPLVVDSTFLHPVQEKLPRADRAIKAHPYFFKENVEIWFEPEFISSDLFATHDYVYLTRNEFTIIRRNENSIQ